MAKSNEPIWWSLFSAGGVVAALLIPALICITGIALPVIQAPDHARLLELASHPVGRILLFLVLSLPFFHWAHRFRYTLIDLGMQGGRVVVATLCYGTAIVVTVIAASVVLSL